ncbi:MBL fold metallo-hydrolase [Candidatus Falkowbacteria bacterium]|nr:MBL fold metallo-hydrolase [Candidatus Falkowbacteria bacterium]
MKKSFIIIIIILGSLFLLYLVFAAQKEKDLEVVFLQVGQGDSILARSPYGQNILIDGGPDNTVVYELGRSLPFYDRTIDLMILTHPHADHVTGLIEVLKRYEVKNILYTGVNHSSPAYLEFLKTIKEKQIPMKIVSSRQKIKLGEDLYLDVIWPLNDLVNKEVNNLNNTSIVARLNYKDASFLFTGDIEKETEQELLNIYSDLGSDVLKVAHHGSDTSSTRDLLEAVSAKIAVITYGDNNFGFPSFDVLKRLESLEMDVLDTSRMRISIKSNGFNVFR